jgi:hypothetical protein
MSRNVVVYELMSLDGFADDPGEGEWFGDADARLIDFLGDVIATQDTVLPPGRIAPGRRTEPRWPRQALLRRRCPNSRAPTLPAGMAASP